MSPRDEAFAEAVAGIALQLTNEGKLIAAGFAIYRALAMPADAGTVQVDECRLAFFAGAQHLFGALMGILDPGEEATAADLRKMDAINDELRRFAEELKLRLARAGGEG